METSHNFQRPEDRANMIEVRIRMFEVNGVDLKADAVDNNRVVTNSIVPMEAVHSVMSSDSPNITKYLPIPNLILLISILSIILMFVILVSVGVVKYLHREKGETYYTQEEGLMQPSTTTSS